MMAEAASSAKGEPAIIEPLCAVFRRTLKRAGLKYTPQRAQVLDAILGIEGLFEAEQLQGALRRAGRRVSKATVYRTIRLLLEAGVIQRVLMDEMDQSYYQLVYGRRPHDLLIRLDTRQAEAVEVPEVVEIVRGVCGARGLRLVGHRLQIFAVGP